MQRRSVLLPFISAFASAEVGATLIWPVRPIRIIVVYPAGGVSDQICRLIASEASALLQVPVLVENRAGAGGSVGMHALAQSAPDGYTLGFAAISTLSSLPKLTRVAYDPLGDFLPVIGIMRTPTLVIGTAQYRGTTLIDVTALASSTPGGYRWATSGVGTTGHLVMEQVRLATKASLVHIPYKGGGQQINDALSAQFELLSTNLGPTQLQHIQSGRLRPLAIGSAVRARQLPGVPTLEEIGYPKANLMSTFGVFAPANTPRSIAKRINAALNTVLGTPPLRTRLGEFDDMLLGGSAQQFVSLVEKETRDISQTLREITRD